MIGDNRELILGPKLAEEQEKGHREAAPGRDFFRQEQKVFLDYELLELLLTYTVIRRIAGELLRIC